MMNSIAMKSLLGCAELNSAQIRWFLSIARIFSETSRKNQEIPAFLKGLTIVNLFFENSTRTRMSFEVAIRRLGGGVMNFAPSTSSVNKGESLVDTAKNIAALQAHCLVVRHTSAGSPHLLHQELGIPVINAGDGFHEHPTQALLDVFTMEEKLGNISGKKILIVGDIAHSRVARSNIHLLKKLGASVVVCAPGTLLPLDIEMWGVGFSYQLDELLPEMDVVMTLRIQAERQNRMQLPSLQEYSRFWGISVERTKKMKPDAILLHPGPMNRGVEIDSRVADGKSSVILNQVSNGVWIRMAALATLCNPMGLNRWIEEGGHRV